VTTGALLTQHRSEAGDCAGKAQQNMNADDGQKGRIIGGYLDAG
jgi:hypothetical protein